MLNGSSTITWCRRLHHIFKKSYIPSSKIAEILEKNVIYNQDGLLVLNKPYDISFSQSVIKNKKADPLEISFSTILPFLKEYFGFTHLYNVRVPERYISGVAIFCTEQRLQKQLHANLMRMRTEFIPSDVYHSIVIGHPLTPTSHFKGVIKLEQSPSSPNKKCTVLVPTCSKRERQRGLAKAIVINHKTLKMNGQLSLIEVESSRNSWHSIRAYLSTMLLSPILGDNIYGSRVKQVLGKTVLIEKFSPAAEIPQQLSKEIMKNLQLNNIKDVAVPLHLHLSNVTINRYDSKGSHYQFSAPKPEPFLWSCESLGLT